VNTYDLSNASAPVTKAKFVNSITALAISDDGQVSVAGVAPLFLQDQSPEWGAKSFASLRRNGAMWERQVKAGFDGFPVDVVAISNGAGTAALVSSSGQTGPLSLHTTLPTKLFSN
jgi:hypothetical protein